MTPEVTIGLACAVALAVAIPAVGFLVVRRVVSDYDAAAVAATYGSVSAVTFITAVQYLESHGIAYGGHMAAAMALMESPAIILAMLAANVLRRRAAATVGAGARWRSAARRCDRPRAARVVHRRRPSCCCSLDARRHPQRDAGKASMQPFSGDLFKGMLAFFLLDMGLVTARKVGHLRGKSPALLVYAVIAPLVHSLLALALARAAGLATGDAALLAVLAASARTSRARRAAPRDARSEPLALLRDVARTHLSVQHRGRHSALRVAATRFVP